MNRDQEEHMTVEQRETALNRANAIKTARAELRRRLRAGEIDLAAALETDAAQDMDVWHLASAQHRWGKKKVLELAIALDRAGVSIHYGKRVRTMTVRQRLALLHFSTLPPTGPRPKTLPAPLRPPPRAIRPDREPRCSRCHYGMREATDEGLCGFCIAEDEQVAA